MANTKKSNANIKINIAAPVLILLFFLGVVIAINR